MAHIAKRAVLLPACATTVAAAAGCGESTTAGVGSAEQTPAVTTAGSSTTAAEREVSEPTGFITPSGNIACRLDDDYARCDIMDRDWSPPAKPADCRWDYGHGVLIVGAEPATLVCAGDTTFGVEEVLPYGEAVRVGAMRCESAEAGVTCRSEDSGRGFFLSRESYQLI